MHNFIKTLSEIKQKRTILNSRLERAASLGLNFQEISEKI